MLLAYRLVDSRNSGGTTGEQAEVGWPITWETAEGHPAALPGQLRPVRHGQAARSLRALQPRPEGQDAEDRLSATSR